MKKSDCLFVYDEDDLKDDLNSLGIEINDENIKLASNLIYNLDASDFYHDIFLKLDKLFNEH